MSYNRGGHGGTVAVSFSTGSIAPMSPNRRLSSGSTGSSTSGVGSSSTKLSSYRSSSTFDRAGSYYSTSSGSSFSYVPTHRSPLSSEYRRNCSPARSVSSSAYSDTGTTRCSTSRERSETRETLASLYAKYSPSNYVPNITGSSLSTSIFGGNASDARTIRPQDTTDSVAFSTSLGRPPRATRRPALSTLLTTHHAQSTDEVTHDDRNNNNATELLPVKTHGPAVGVSPTPKCPLLTNASNTQLTNNNEEESRLAFNGSQEAESLEASLVEKPSLDLSSGSVGNGLSGRPSGGHGGDLSMPSTSRRGDSFPGAGGAGNATVGVEAPAVMQQSIYRSGSELRDGSPTARTARNRLQAPRDERCGLNGLRNIGNTCFMNSVIQCLSNTRPLLEYLLNEQYLADINTSTSGMKGALIKAFSQVIQELWEVGGDHVVNTSSLKSQIQRFAPRFMGYSQQDAQEFLRYLLEGLHEDVNRVTVKPQPIHTDIPDHYTDSQKAAESWKRYLRSEDSTIVDVFVGQLRSSLHCTSCGHVSVTLDPFWDLSLPIPTRSGTVKMSQCLEHFTKEEVLDGDEKPTCSKCQMRRKCTKSFSIQKFPKILVIHLKRFSPMERFRGKLNTLVDFPLTSLDLSAFAAPRVQGCTYNLYGVANHSGTTYSGHYTAYCKHPYSGEWHEYNDSRVSSVPARSVVSSEAYVLFYEQQPHSSHL